MTEQEAWLLETAAQGREMYAQGASERDAELLHHEASAYRHAACIIEDPTRLQGVIPSWMPLPERPQDGPKARELMLLWQHPETTRAIVIGLLGYDGKNYTFTYTKEAGETSTYRPIPGLPLGKRYTSTELPAAIAQRVMGPQRPDYPAYIESLGLDPATASPWDQLVASGGIRMGDYYSLIPAPTLDNTPTGGNAL